MIKFITRRKRSWAPNGRRAKELAAGCQRQWRGYFQLWQGEKLRGPLADGVSEWKAGCFICFEKGCGTCGPGGDAHGAGTSGTINLKSLHLTTCGFGDCDGGGWIGRVWPDLGLRPVMCVGFTVSQHVLTDATGQMIGRWTMNEGQMANREVSAVSRTCHCAAVDERLRESRHSGVFSCVYLGGQVGNTGNKQMPRELGAALQIAVQNSYSET